MADIPVAALDGLLLMFTWKTFLFMMIGIFAGMFFGLVPGLSGLSGLGLLLRLPSASRPKSRFRS